MVREGVAEAVEVLEGPALIARQHRDSVSESGGGLLEPLMQGGGCTRGDDIGNILLSCEIDVNMRGMYCSRHA